MKARTWAAAAVLAGSLHAGEAGAAEPSPGRTRYQLAPAIDVPVLAVSGTIAASWLLSHELEPASCAPRCAREDVNAFDRVAAGVYRRPWKRVSDVGVAVILAAGAATVLADEGVREGLGDLLLFVESVLVANAAAVTTQMAVRRPRPLVYGDRAPLEVRTDGNAALSFFSGHTATSFAAATSTFWMLHARHPRSVGPFVALFAGLAASSVVGVSRVLAGDHFPTDVIAGAAAGASIGTLVPALHAVDLQVEPVADVRGAFAGFGVRLQAPH